jgi:hypothetical protein
MEKFASADARSTGGLLPINWDLSSGKPFDGNMVLVCFKACLNLMSGLLQLNCPWVRRRTAGTNICSSIIC